MLHNSTRNILRSAAKLVFTVFGLAFIREFQFWPVVLKHAQVAKLVFRECHGPLYSHPLDKA